DEDVAQRFIYVEASRGCPFKCEFCLSSLDKTAWAFDLDLFLSELAALYARGARHFKFVDRTFNLKAAAGLRILEFFLERLDDSLFVHFEVIPDHLPGSLKTAITRFPPGTLQFEVGIQTWNPAVQSLISRRQNNEASAENLAWLRNESNAHL
ncbi:MAG: radical SAM protein, partial [Pseudomonadota bacterium]